MLAAFVDDEAPVLVDDIGQGARGPNGFPTGHARSGDDPGGQDAEVTVRESAAGM